MDQNQHSDSAAVFDGNRSFDDLTNQSRLKGLAIVSIGISQLPLAFMLADVTGYNISIFVIGTGGWLLISIGVNVFRGKEVFEIGWSESEQVEWLSTVLMVIFAIAVVAAAGFISLT